MRKELEFYTGDRQYKETIINWYYLTNLSVVKSSYDGTLRRIKWLGQSPDRNLTAEITLMVRK